MKPTTLASPVLIALALAACAAPMAPPGPTAQARIEATRGNTVSGTAQFRQAGNQVHLEVAVSGLSPGAHGFHVHEKGDCSSGDGASAGGHFNPLGKSHAHPASADRHAGDLPQLEAGADGNARLIADVDVIRIGEGATDIVGRAVVVHAGPDDFKTQPAGNSGPRVACGVITRG